MYKEKKGGGGVSEEQRGPCNFYGPARRVWKDFLRICKREGSSASEKLTGYVEQYVEVHRPGNPQTLMPSYAENGAVNMENLEGRLRQQCVEWARKNGSISYDDVVLRAKGLGVDPKPRVAMARRTVKWLREVMMVKVTL